jgi:hypothetical protein
MNLYIVVDCKTHNCRTVHVLMHLGEKGKTPSKVEYWMSYPLMVDCPTCSKTYDYSDSQEKFWQKRASGSPVWIFEQARPAVGSERIYSEEN